MKNLLKIALFVLIGTNSYSQQDPMLTQYMFNGLFLNPAYAGSHKYWSSSMNFRSQWVDAKFDGAPRTAIAAVDGPIPGQNMGLGFMVSNDQIGVTNTSSVTANYAYQVKLNKKTKLAFGINAGIHQFSAKLPDALIWDEEDVVYANHLTKTLPRFGTGAYLFSEKFYVGLSIPTLWAYESGNDFSLNISKSSFLRRHYLLTGGVVFNVSENVKFKPSTLLKYTSNVPLEVDLNFSAIFNDKFWVGTSYRSMDAIAILLQYQSNSYFRVGYSYDITFSNMRRYQNGSHEIMIGIDFGKDLIKIKTPRYF